jgi:hypothetical protein
MRTLYNRRQAHARPRRRLTAGSLRATPSHAGTPPWTDINAHTPVPLDISQEMPKMSTHIGYGYGGSLTLWLLAMAMAPRGAASLGAPRAAATGGEARPRRHLTQSAPPPPTWFQTGRAWTCNEARGRVFGVGDSLSDFSLHQG